MWNGQDAFLRLDDQSLLSCAKRYAHLGSITTATGNLRPDLARRATKASQVVGALAGTVFAERGITRKMRLDLVVSVVDSVLLSAAAPWDDLKDHEYKILEAPRMKAVRRVAGLLPGPGGPNDAQVMASMGVPSLALKHRCIRLQYVARVHRHAPQQLRKLLSSPAAASWWKAVMFSLDHMKVCMEKQLESLPLANDDLDPWMLLWAQHPHAWRKLVKLYQARATSWEAMAAWSRGDDEGEGACAGEHFACVDCAVTFPSFARLQAHMFAKHGVAKWTRKYVAGNTCPACGQCFWSRIRVLRHIDNVPACKMFLAENQSLELDHKVIWQANNEDR